MFGPEDLQSALRRAVELIHREDGATSIDAMVLGGLLEATEGGLQDGPEAAGKAWMDLVWPGGENQRPIDRVLRVIEEALELGQSEGVELAEALGLVHQVYGKPVGEAGAEFAGLVFTVACYAASRQWQMGPAFYAELTRVKDPAVIERVRWKVESGEVVTRTGD